MTRATAPGVHFKGIREGLLLTLPDGPDDDYPLLVEQVRAELVEKEAFLQGSRVVIDVGRRPLERSDLSGLQGLIEEHGLVLWAVLAQEEGTKGAARSLGLGTRLPGSSTDLEGNHLAAGGQTEPPPASGAEAPPSNALLLRETIRSGQSIFHEGHVVVIGDVNPGAEVIATGNVIVWGRLRGLVHAGAQENSEAIICALELVPTQLRIADQIAIPPEERAYELTPERASIRDGQIVADPWQERG